MSGTLAEWEPPSPAELRELEAEGRRRSNLSPHERAAAMRRGQAQVAEYLAAAGDEVPWTAEPEALPPLHAPVPELPAELLPPALRPWLTDVADRLSVPLEFVAMPAVTCLGAVVGRTLGVRPQMQGDWTVVPNLWGAIVGPPGVMKTAAIDEATRPLLRLARRASEEFEAREAERAASLEEARAKRDAIRIGLRRTSSKAGDTTKLREELQDVERRLRVEEKQAERRYVTSDATIEKLAVLLKETPRGILLSRDELTGWLRGFDREDRGQERAFFLEAWNGTNSFAVDRITRGTVNVSGLCVSVLGGIQPARLQPYVQSAVAQDAAADGLLSRFQLLVWPDEFGAWKAVDRPPDHESRCRADAIFERLDTLAPEAVGAEPDAPSRVPALRFEERAVELFVDWRRDLEARLRSPEISRQRPAFCQHLTKYRKLVPSLALLFHLVDVVEGRGAGRVSLEAVRLALCWSEYLELHARKLYAAESKQDLAAAQTLAARIASGDVSDGMTVRAIAERDWSGLTTRGAVYAAIERLEALGWLRLQTIEAGPRGGRPSDVVRLHPSFRRTA